MLVLLATVAFLLTLSSTQWAAPRAHAAFLDTDGDGVPDETELLFGSDPHDATSTPEVGGNFAGLIAHATNHCSDGIDNDKDGLIDSADPDCMDSDGDGIPDSVEQVLGSNPQDAESFPENSRFDNFLIAAGYPVQLCTDGRDDDKDGLTDAADPGCTSIDSDGDGFADITEKSVGSDWLDPSSVPEHNAVNPGSCTDGIDNDHDGLIDAADPGCVTLSNDNMADATVVNSLPFDDATKSLGATTEPGEPSPNCALYAIEGTVWYSFTAPADMPVVIDTAGSDFAAVVAVWTADPFGYSQHACNNGFLFSLSTRFAFQATHGVTYLIQVGRNSLLYSGADRLTIHMEAGVRPANDNFADAAEISAIPSSISADIVAATTEAHEPKSSCAFGPILNTVWYRYTPASDTYVLADTAGSDVASHDLTVYQGPSLGNLTQIACGWPFGSPSHQLAFLAKAGQTYYLQAAAEGFSIDAPVISRAAPAAAPFASGTHIQVNLHILDVPSCPPPTFTIPDRVGDQIVDAAQPDILSVSGAFTPDYSCVTIQLDRQLAGADEAGIDLDTDQNRSIGTTGFVEKVCRRPTGLGVDIETLIEPREGLLTPMNGVSSVLYQPAITLVDGTSYTTIFPLTALGGGDHLSFAVTVWGHGQSSDCAPDGGHIACGGGTCAFSRFHNGDANCSGPADAIDAAIVLQVSAGLIASVACPDAADVNGDGQINSLDAVLILQFSAGLLDQLPPEAPFPTPPPGPRATPHPTP
jgi:hypothetical protein